MLKELPVTSDQESLRHAPVHSLMLAVTDDCPQRCDYCFVAKQPRRMSFETARKAIDFLLHQNVSARRLSPTVTFFGGEPFLELELLEQIVDYAATAPSSIRKTIRFSATTGATIANARLKRLLERSKMELLISFDGTEKAMQHRRFASGRSAYDCIARNLPRLVEWSSLSIVRMTYHPGTLDFVANIGHALELGATSVALAPVVESDWRGHEDRLETAHQSLADWFIEEARRGKLLPLGGSWITLRQIDRARRGASRPARPCPVGTTTLGIDPDGHVMPCHRFLYRPQDWLGTVDRPWLSAARDQYLDLSSDENFACESCSARQVCGGGCRAVALGARLGLHGIHPGHCLTLRAQYRASVRIYDTLLQERNAAFLHQLRSPDRLAASSCGQNLQ